MDPVTQGALGAIATQALMGKRLKTSAWKIGALAGMAPDLDSFIRSQDPFVYLLYHRNFTHSLSFVPVGAFVVWLIYLLFNRGRYKKLDLYWGACIGYATHGLLDACTTYGTMLYWPFSTQRVEWDFMSIVDPIYTVMLLIGVIAAIMSKSMRPARFCFILGFIYMAFAFYQHHQVIQIQKQIAISRGHVPVHYKAVPTLGNSILWRGIYEYQDRFYTNGIRLPLGQAPQWKEGKDIAKVTPQLFVDMYANGTANLPIYEFLKWFSNDHLVWDRFDTDMLSDFRYGTFPEGLEVSWARFKIDFSQSPAKVTLQPNRKIFSDRIKEYWDQILNGTGYVPLKF